MVIKYKSSDNNTSQRGYDVHLTQFQSCGSNSSPQSSQIVFVCITDFLDKAMLSQSFKKPGHLMALFAFDDLTQGFITEPADVKFTTDNSTEQFKVISIKEIEPPIAAVIFFDRPGYFVQVSDSAGRVINSRDKLNVPAIGRFDQFEKYRPAVNGFFQRRSFHFPCAVPMFHPSVVSKERDIIGHSFNPKDDTELVIHLYGNFTHSMFNTGSFDPRVKVIAHFILIAAVEFTTKECGNVLGLDRVNGCADDFVIDQLKIVLLFKDDIRSVFDLHKTPMIAMGKVPDDRTVLSDNFVQLSMNTPDIDAISKILSFIEIVDLHKDIIKDFGIDFLFTESRCQHIMSVTIELQSERCPCRYSQITQAKLGSDKVEVIMQAFTRHRFEICFMGLFIMPGFISSAGFHRRKDMYKSGMRTSLFDNIVNAVFFSEILFTDEIDFQAVFCSQFLGIKTNFFSHRFNEVGVVKDLNVFFEEHRSHPLGITNARYSSSQYDSVKAGDDAFDFSIVPLDKILHSSGSPYQSVEFEQLSEKCRAA